MKVVFLTTNHEFSSVLSAAEPVSGSGRSFPKHCRKTCHSGHGSCIVFVSPEFEVSLVSIPGAALEHVKNPHDRPIGQMGKLRYFLRSAFFLVHAAFFSVLGAQTSKSLLDYPENIFSVS